MGRSAWSLWALVVSDLRLSEARGRGNAWCATLVDLDLGRAAMLGTREAARTFRVGLGAAYGTHGLASGRSGGSLWVSVVSDPRLYEVCSGSRMVLFVGPW